jgi:putative endonuclease
MSEATDTVALVDTRLTGRIGEDAAERWYAGRGYRLLARNWRCRLGELDLVVARGDTVVVCEVKARRGASYGGGWEAVHARKRAKLRSLAQAFLLSRDLRPRSVRFDVASVAVGSEGSVRLHVFHDAF